MTGLELTEAALAAHRLTRLVVEDEITSDLRDAAIEAVYRRHHDTESLAELEGTGKARVEADPDPPKLAYLLTCPWCSGFYVAIAVTALERARPRGWATVRRVLALSSAAGLIAGHETP